MTIQDLQKFLESQVPGACVPVDLLRIAKSVGYRRSRIGGRPGYNQSGVLTLVVDGECCLDRLYGGFFSGRYKIRKLWISAKWYSREVF